jgi:hypothetical protein
MLAHHVEWGLFQEFKFATLKKVLKHKKFVINRIAWTESKKKYEKFVPQFNIHML